MLYYLRNKKLKKLKGWEVLAKMRCDLWDSITRPRRFLTQQHSLFFVFHVSAKFKADKYNKALVRAVSVAAKGEGDVGEPDLGWWSAQTERYGRARVNGLLEAQVKLATERALALRREEEGAPRIAAAERNAAASTRGAAVRRPLLIERDDGLSEGLIAG